MLIPIKCTGSRTVSYKELLPFQKNLKVATNIQKLKDNIKQNGFVAPIFVWNGKEILDGHGRLKALTELINEGYTIGDLPVVDIEAKNKKEAATILLSINSSYQKITQEGLNEFVLDNSIEYDQISDMIELSIYEPITQETDIDVDNDQEKADSAPIIDDSKPITQPGDLWILGKHRLLCGDSTDPINIERLMDGKKANFIITDPPYGMNLNTDFTDFGYKSKTNKNKDLKSCVRKNYDAVLNDDKDYDPSHIFRDFPYCKEIFLFGADYYAERLPKKNDGTWLIWDKRAGIEDVEFSLSEFETIWSKHTHARIILRHRWFGMMGTENKAEDIHKRVHPNQKPVKLLIDILERYSKKNDIVVDLFAGSGSTIIACERSDQQCFCMEFTPKYCDLILKRYVDFTKNTPVREDGLEWEP